MTTSPLRVALCLATGIFLWAATDLAAAAAQPLVSAEWLRGHLGAKGFLVVDIRPKVDFEAEHIPGAVNGEYPDAWRQADGALLSLKALGRNLSALGVGTDRTVVIVSAGGDSTDLGGATFAYWVLKYLGHEETSILDGGWAAWRSESTDPVQAGPSAPIRINFTPVPRPELRASTRQVAELLGTDTVLLDARSADQYGGITKSDLVSRAGRIPGAINLPFSGLFDDAAHRLKATSDLAALMPPELAKSETRIVTYCNTGHWSSIDWFVLHELLGHADTRLYDGSMAAWTSDRKRPVETAASPAR